MPALRTIDTIRALRALAGPWDELWHRSGVHLPTKRAEMLAQWLEHFAPSARFLALVVEERGKLLAALPLVGTRLGGVLPVGTLPVNSYSSAGDLLLDRSSASAPVLTCLANGLRCLPWPLLWIDTVEFEEPRWRAFADACRGAGLPIETRRQFDLGLVDVANDWDRYQAGWSKNHRKDMHRRLRRARSRGELKLELHEDVPPDQVERHLMAGWEVEDRSWKGAAGTSVLRTRGSREFYLEQAQQLARWGYLRIAILRLDDRPIAFEYGYRAEGVYFSHKVGYDNAYRELAPGQLLMMVLLERDHADPTMRLTNCMGMLTGAVAKWCTRVQAIGRLAVGTGGPVGSASLVGYRTIGPRVARLRAVLGRRREPPKFAPGCRVPVNVPVNREPLESSV